MRKLGIDMEEPSLFLHSVMLENLFMCLTFALSTRNKLEAKSMYGLTLVQNHKSSSSSELVCALLGVVNGCIGFFSKPC